jgi:Txe/YoeB family toxin of Txe-Axe toxin-antitoxin module
MKTLDEINKEVAKELKLPLDVVESINKNIGTFYINPKKIVRRISCLLGNLVRLKQMNNPKMDNVKKVVTGAFKDRWAIKQRLGFRLTDKTVKYANMKVGYIKHYQYRDTNESENDNLD